MPIDLRQDWPAALRDAGFDATKPCAWTAEGLLPFLPADAQDRLLDNITALSVDGSRLATEVAVMSAPADGDQIVDSVDDVTKRWRDHGFDIDLGELGYPEERDDVADYLDSRGWRRFASRCRTCSPMRGSRGFRKLTARPPSATTTTAHQ